MDPPFRLSPVTVTATAPLLVFETAGHLATPHAPRLREQARWSTGPPASRDTASMEVGAVPR